MGADEIVVSEDVLIWPSSDEGIEDGHDCPERWDSEMVWPGTPAVGGSCTFVVDKSLRIMGRAARRFMLLRPQACQWVESCIRPAGRRETTHRCTQARVDPKLQVL